MYQRAFVAVVITLLVDAALDAFRAFVADVRPVVARRVERQVHPSIASASCGIAGAVKRALVEVVAVDPSAQVDDSPRAAFTAGTTSAPALACGPTATGNTARASAASAGAAADSGNTAGATIS